MGARARLEAKGSHPRVMMTAAKARARPRVASRPIPVGVMVTPEARVNQERAKEAATINHLGVAAGTTAGATGGVTLLVVMAEAREASPRATGDHCKPLTLHEGSTP